MHDKFEVYNKKTGEPLRRRIGGQPALFNGKAPAEILIIHIGEKYSNFHEAAHKTFDVPDDAELDVRPVAVEV